MQKTHFFETHFFCEQISGQKTVVLSHEESHHIKKVLRLRPGTHIKLSDGKGLVAVGKIGEITSPQIHVELISQSQIERKAMLHLAVACLKDRHLEDVLEHCAQLPLGSFTLLRTQHSLEPRKSNLQATTRRLQQKAVVALKQSLTPWLCQVRGPVYLKDWLTEQKQPLIVCYPQGESTLPTHILADLNTNLPSGDNEPIIIVGPEGGFSPEEIEVFKQNNAFFYKLGDTRLRARTAPIVALSSILAMSQSLNERR